jgi:hypothetical protein
MNRSFLMMALVVVVSVGAAVAQWQQNGKPVADEPWRKSVGKFGVMMLLTDRPDEFLADWEKPTPGVPIATTGKAHRGSKVVAFLVFQGCTPDSAGLCNATADFRILRPDGTEYGAYKDQDLWKSKRAGPSDRIELGVAYVGIRVEDTDPLGEYRFLAEVTDANAGKVIELEQRLQVTAE